MTLLPNVIYVSQSGGEANVLGSSLNGLNSEIGVSSSTSQTTASIVYTPRIDHTGKPSWIPITGLSNSFTFLYPVLVKIERSDGVFISECPTFNLFTFADTYEEALDSIKSLLVDDYQVLFESYPHSLTVDAIKTLRLYCAFLGRDLT